MTKQTEYQYRYRAKYPEKFVGKAYRDKMNEYNRAYRRKHHKRLRAEDNKRMREFRKNHPGHQQKQNLKSRRPMVELIHYIKAHNPCTDCGHRFHHCAMDFDHVRGEKWMSVSSIVSRGNMDRLVEEIDKCELVCSNCHRVRTYNRGKFWGRGPTGAMTACGPLMDGDT